MVDPAEVENGRSRKQPRRREGRQKRLPNARRHGPLGPSLLIQQEGLQEEFGEVRLQVPRCFQHRGRRQLTSCLCPQFVELQELRQRRPCRFRHQSRRVELLELPARQEERELRRR